MPDVPLRDRSRWVARVRMAFQDVSDATLDFGSSAIMAVRAHRRRAIAAGISVVLAVVGLVLVFSGGPTHRTPHSTEAAASPTPSATSARAAPAGARPRSTAPTKHRSAPAPAPAVAAFMHISIPSISVVAGVMQLGLNTDRTIQVPPLNQVGTAGWYQYSPLPGEPGPSVILGHINSAQYGPGVFVKLAAMHPGDLITVERPDHQRAVFRADKVAEYPKSKFPTSEIYGNTDGAKIRLITCGGQFDSSTGNYLDNIVVYGSLVSLGRT